MLQFSNLLGRFGFVSGVMSFNLRRELIGSDLQVATLVVTLFLYFNRLRNQLRLLGGG